MRKVWEGTKVLGRAALRTGKRAAPPIVSSDTLWNMHPEDCSFSLVICLLHIGQLANKAPSNTTCDGYLCLPEVFYSGEVNHVICVKTTAMSEKFYHVSATVCRGSYTQ